MTTAELIKELQRADPSGTAHVRLPGGGALIGVEPKEGYWDGPYSYMTPDGVYHTTSKGNKVDFIVETATDIIWDERGNMDKLKELFSFDFGNYSIPEQRQERIDNFWKWAEKEAASAKHQADKSMEKFTKQMLQWVAKHGIEEFTYKPTNGQPSGYLSPNWAAYAEGIKIDRSFCIGDIRVIRESGLFSMQEREGLEVWTLN